VEVLSVGGTQVPSNAISPSEQLKSSAWATAIGTPITANAADNAPAATESRTVRDIAAVNVVAPIACLFSCGVGLDVPT
jgi:hypothetical protein